MSASRFLERRREEDGREERSVNTHFRLKGLSLAEDVWDLLPCLGALLERSEDLLSHLLLLKDSNTIETRSARQKGRAQRKNGREDESEPEEGRCRKH